MITQKLSSDRFRGGRPHLRPCGSVTVHPLPKLRRGAENIRVFGSVARGQDRADSDLELLVDFDVRSGGLFPLARLADELTLLQGERVEVVPAGALAQRVAKNALAEAVPL